jgi:Tfp pilus assembly protein PilF
MTNSRIDSLREMLEKDPGDCFAKYALGLEFMSQNDFERAKDIFEELRISDSKYFATYYQLGKVYEMLGDDAAAKKIYECGIFVTTQLGELHARNELEQAINDLL